jgi:hypothetical protein
MLVAHRSRRWPILAAALLAAACAESAANSPEAALDALAQESLARSTAPRRCRRTSAFGS